MKVLVVLALCVAVALAAVPADREAREAKNVAAVAKDATVVAKDDAVAMTKDVPVMMKDTVKPMKPVTDRKRKYSYQVARLKTFLQQRSG